ncbi:hypothetical protein PPTG_12283 [Phytophthora nicotianae INRA-310]|uniref:Uncharacterized protein n=3 Tax=Phytophthora nicotianae TaxID=4792 RepID=W2Q6L4_PHYN3|nr:hypothetical protein PPTG_12283 [Phytophthora nicotianae INRA-310]ETM46028.1 hypothetical protein L914_09030 [Phytophthora nicotianae]ETN08511.1 hypothetical protein PPTG_12283 [Phytophthora nicotianae INRA-310]ETO74920.1 hypothetical protein F444_09429 [Phytophthora nicotianae P1976]
MKRLAVQLTGQHAKPNPTRHNVMDRFEPEPEARPTLSQVQSFLSHHKRAKLRGTDFVEDMECLAARYKFNAYMSDSDPFYLALT